MSSLPAFSLSLMSNSVWTAAEAAIRTLRTAGYPNVCFVGGVACCLHGNTRTPKDLDILILNTSDGQEDIKRRMVEVNPSFYQISGKRAFATYKVLWYRSIYGPIKVDILLPGIMDIPSFLSIRIDSSNTRRLPSAPLSIVLLLKLQAWSQHRASLEWYYSKEQDKDKRDLEALVPIAARQSIRPKDDRDLPTAFIRAAETRVCEFLRVDQTSPTRAGWIAMGFSVPEASPLANVRSRTVSIDENLGTGSRYRVKPLPRTRALYTFGSSRY